MLSLIPIKSTGYYQKEEFKKADDYYAENKKDKNKTVEESFYFGGVAKELEIDKQQVHIEALQDYISGFCPKTKKFLFKEKNVRNYTDAKMKGKGQKDTMSYGIDFTFNTPKDFSLLAELDEKNSKVYDDILVKATERALNKIEELTVYRKRKTGKEESDYVGNAKILSMNYIHRTARTSEGNRPDPHTHVHCVVPDRIMNENGEWRTYFNKVFYHKTVKLLGTLFRAELANGLREIGYVIEPIKEEEVLEDGKKNKVDSFKVRGITDEQRKNFSNRAEKMKSKVGEDASAITKQNEILKSREFKEGNYDKKELKSIWKKEAKQLGLTQEKIDSIKVKDPISYTKNYIKTEEHLLKYCLERGKILEQNLLIKLYENEQYTGIKAEKEFDRLVKHNLVEKPTQTYIKKEKIKRKVVKKYEAKNYEYKTKLNIKNADSIQKKCDIAFNKLFEKNKISIADIKQERYGLTVEQYLDKHIDSAKKVEKNKGVNISLYSSSSPLLIRLGILELLIRNPDMSEESKADINVEIEMLKWQIRNETVAKLNEDNKDEMRFE